MALRIPKKDLIVITVMSIGVLAGILLLKQSQEFREKAQTDDVRLYTVCHKTGDSVNPWEEIEVYEKEIYFHMSHGDKIGSCGFHLTPTPVPTFYFPIPTVPEATTVPTSRPTLRPTPTFILTPAFFPTLQPTLLPTPEFVEDTEEGDLKEDVYLESLTSVFFSVKFQLVDVRRPSQNIRATFRPEAGKDLVYENVELEADSSGTYSGVISDVEPGIYDVYMKGLSHLQRKVANIRVSEGINRYDWTDYVFLAGDFDGNEIINLYDLALIIQYYRQEENLITDFSINYDVNFDGLINIEDIDGVVGNYTSLEIFGDEKS